MTMMIKAKDAECRNGMAQAELRYQAIAKAFAAPGPVATVHVLHSSATKKPVCNYNPNGRGEQLVAAR